MLNANLKQQQVDNKKANSANFQRKVHTNPMQYNGANNRNNIFSENNYYLPKDYYTTIDVSSNATQQTNANTNHTNSSAPIGLGGGGGGNGASVGLIDTATTNTSHLLTDQLSVLFPKCRPKNDANLNKTSLYIDTSVAPATATALASASQLLATSPSNGDYKNQNQLIDDFGAGDETQHIDNSRAFHMRANHCNSNQAADNKHCAADEPRMQPPSNAAAGMDEMPVQRANHTSYRAANSNHQRAAMAFTQQAFGQQNAADYHGMGNFDAMNAGRAAHKHEARWADGELDFLRDIPMWEKRKRSPHQTPATNVLNSPDFNEPHAYSHRPAQHQIKVGRSPVNQHDGNRERCTSPVSPVQAPPPVRVSKGRTAALTVDGDFIFDDIDDWRAPKSDKHSQLKQQPNKTQTQRFNHMLFDDDDDDYYADEREQSNAKNASISAENVTKMIGEFGWVHISLFCFIIFALKSKIPVHARKFARSRSPCHLLSALARINWFIAIFRCSFCLPMSFVTSRHRHALDPRPTTRLLTQTKAFCRLQNTKARRDASATINKSYLIINAAPMRPRPKIKPAPQIGHPVHAKCSHRPRSFRHGPAFRRYAFAAAQQLR